MTKQKKYNYIYKITNNLNGKIYIGRHCTNRLNDRYMGSGFKLTEDMKQLGRHNFTKEILFMFDTWEEMVKKETELLTEEFVNREDTYNLSGQGTGLVTHTPEARAKLSKANKGKVPVKDADGNNLNVSVNDPRYLSGELKHNTCGTICVKDAEGKLFRVPVDDPRRLSGELVSANAGRKQTNERIEHRVKKTLEWWESNSHSDETLKKMHDVNVGKVSVKDKDGNIFRVPVDDERLKTGEVVYMWVGKTHSDEAKAKISKSKTGFIWITNNQLKKNKLIRPEEIDDFIKNGWKKGVICYNKIKN